MDVLKEINMQAGVLNNKVIVVTGGAGLLGDYFVRDIAKKDGIVIVVPSYIPKRGVIDP